MTTRSCLVLFTVMLCLSFSIVQSEKLFAKDPEIKPEEVVAKHLKSIGQPEILATIKSRVVVGTASAEFFQGVIRTPTNGQFQIVSERRRLGIDMKFDDSGYRGEYFAFDGHDETFSNYSQIFSGVYYTQCHGLLEEGLMGGTLSAAWPLLDMQERRPKLKYSKRIIEGRQLHELTYVPKSKSRNGTFQLRIKLYFDLETFRHVMTEYHLVRTESNAYASSNIILLLQEKFEDFSEVDGLILPHRYTIYYSATSASGAVLIGRWTLKAEHWLHNAPIDPQLFKAE